MTSSSTRRTLFPHWYVAVWALLLVLFGAFFIAYKLGASGVRISGSVLSFNRQQDNLLFKIDDERAFNIHPLAELNEFIAIVFYRKAYFPFSAVCGTYTPNGTVINNATYKKGDWIYTKYPYFKGTSVFNTSTKMVYAPFSPTPELGKDIKIEEVPFYQEKNFSFDESYKLSRQQIMQNFSPLSTCKESCMVVIVAFLFCCFLWALPMPYFFWRRKKNIQPKPSY